jgi:hypothetical protein
MRDNAKVAYEAGIHEGMFIPARGSRAARHNERAKRLRIPQFATIARERPEERLNSVPKPLIFLWDQLILRHRKRVRTFSADPGQYILSLAPARQGWRASGLHPKIAYDG